MPPKNIRKHASLTLKVPAPQNDQTLKQFVGNSRRFGCFQGVSKETISMKSVNIFLTFSFLWQWFSLFYCWVNYSGCLNSSRFSWVYHKLHWNLIAIGLVMLYLLHFAQPLYWLQIKQGCDILFPLMSIIRMMKESDSMTEPCGTPGKLEKEKLVNYARVI